MFPICNYSVEYLFFTPYPFPPRPESTLRNNLPQRGR
jgi:hypothetical protein